MQKNNRNQPEKRIWNFQFRKVDSFNLHTPYMSALVIVALTSIYKSPKEANIGHIHTDNPTMIPCSQLLCCIGLNIPQQTVLHSLNSRGTLGNLQEKHKGVSWKVCFSLLMSMCMTSTSNPPVEMQEKHCTQTHSYHVLNEHCNAI